MDLPKLDPESPKLDITYDHFSKTLGFVVESLTGETGTYLFEQRIKELAKTTPFLLTLTGAISRALDHIDITKDDIDKDPERLIKFLEHNEMFCRLQGAITSLIVVSELYVLSLQENPKPSRKRRKKDVS